MGIVIKLENGWLLKKALFPLTFVYPEATVFCTSDGLSLQINDDDRAVTAVLQLNFDLHYCVGNCIAGIDIVNLHNKLSSTRVPDTITIYTGWPPEKDLIKLVIYDTETHGIRNELMTAEDIPRNSFCVNEPAYVFKAIVGVPSEIFMQILLHMYREGQPDSVRAYVTEEEVRFISGEEEDVLTKQSGRCIIGGVGENELVYIRIHYQFIESYIEAAKLCTVIWMLTSDFVGVPDMLYCPIGPQMLGGSIKYYTRHC